MKWLICCAMCNWNKFLVRHSLCLLTAPTLSDTLSVWKHLGDTTADRLIETAQKDTLVRYQVNSVKLSSLPSVLTAKWTSYTIWSNPFHMQWCVFFFAHRIAQTSALLASLLVNLPQNFQIRHNWQFSIAKPDSRSRQAFFRTYHVST